MSSARDGVAGVLENLRVHPELGLDYPQSDISWIRQRDGQQGYEIETTFFGLYGVSSPLPGFYTEELFDDEWEDDRTARGFLDIIHYRLYPLLYQAWLKYRFNLNAVELGKDDYWEIVFSLMGLSGEFRACSDQSGRLLKYAGIISQQPRSQMGLRTILRDLLQGIALDIEPCVARKVKIHPAQRCLLGEQNHRIGDNCVLGEYVVDRSGKFNINLGPVDQQEFNRLAHDKSLVETIKQIVGLFLVQPLVFDICLILQPGAEQQACVGEERGGILGRNTWLGEAGDQQGYRLVIG
jgi:type VI secretion system protein ImpH